MPFSLSLMEAIEQSAIRQFRSNDQLFADSPSPGDRKQMWVANILDDIERSLLDLRSPSTKLHELQGHVKPTRSFSLPNLSEPAATKPGNETIVGDGVESGPKITQPQIAITSVRDLTTRGQRPNYLLHQPVEGGQFLCFPLKPSDDFVVPSPHVTLDELGRRQLGIGLSQLLPLIQELLDSGVAGHARPLQSVSELRIDLSNSNSSYPCTENSATCTGRVENRKPG